MATITATDIITIMTRRGDRVAAAPIFDSYLMVDWSAANQPRRGRDSIWLCHLIREGAGLAIAALENPSTRLAAFARMREILADALVHRRAILVGCDFPFGYAQGLAGRLGLSGPPWRALWDEIAGLLEDRADNVNNRFAVAARLNERISGGAFPFWGCPASKVAPSLAMTHHRRHNAEGLAERRLSDSGRMQPGWKLAGTGSAGGQALTGIPIVRRLRDDPVLAGKAQVWPFEAGLRPLRRESEDGRIVFAEIYPSLVPATPCDGEVKDSAQVRCVAHHFAGLDERRELGVLFAGDPNLRPEERIVVEREEGWVLGIAYAPSSFAGRKPAQATAAG